MIGPDDRKQREHHRAADQHAVVEPPAGVEEGPRDQRQLDEHQAQDEEVDGQVEAVVGDPEEGEQGHGERGSLVTSWLGLRAWRPPRRANA